MDKPSDPKAAQSRKGAERDARRRAELMANMARRKAQVRGRMAQQKQALGEDHPQGQED